MPVDDITHSGRTAAGREPEVIGRADNPLGFALDFLGGRAHVTLGRRRIGPFVRVERLALEVPDVSFPFDVSGGAGRFRHRRCRLRRLEAVIEAEAFASWFTSQRQLAAFGFQPVVMHWQEGGLHLEAMARLGDRLVPITALVRADAEEGGWLRLELGRWQTFGFLPVPPPMLGVGLLAAAGVRPEPWSATAPGETPGGAGNGRSADQGGPAERPGRGSLVRMEGTGVVRVDALGLLLGELLPAYGWRLPRRDDVVVEALHCGPEGLRVAYASREDVEPRARAVGARTASGGASVGGEDSSEAAEPLGEGGSSPGGVVGRGAEPGGAAAVWVTAAPGPRSGPATRESEHLLAVGRVGDALRAFEARLEAEPEDRFARLRRMEILACTPRSIPEARRQARRLLADLEAEAASRPSPRPAPVGREESAATGARETGPPAVAGEAAVAPAHTVVGEAGSEWLAASALFVLATTAEEQGEPAEAASRYAAIAALAERQGDARGAVLATLACGRLLTTPDPAQAISWYERALALEPDLPGAVAALTGLYRRQGRMPELLRLQHRHLARATDRRERLRGHLTLGNIYLTHLGDALRARAEFERAVRLDDGSLAAWDGLAEAHRLAGGHDRERRALERVIDLSAARGDEEAVARARLRMARAWAEAGDLGKALDVTGELLAARPTDPEVLELHGRTSAEAGLWDGAAETLERLLALEGLAPARRSEVALDLARIRLEGLGDPAGARIFVEVSLAAEEREEALRLGVRLAEEEGRAIDLADLLGRLAACLEGAAAASGDGGAEREAAGPGAATPAPAAEAAALRIRQAEVLGRELEDPEQAVAALAPLVARAVTPVPVPSPPGVREALRLQAALLREAGRASALSEATSRLAEWVLGSGASLLEEEVGLLLEHGDALARGAAGGDVPRAVKRAEALRLLRRLHAAAPQDPRPLMALTDLLADAEEQAEREGLLERLATVTERKGDAARQATALRELGGLRWQQGRLEEAQVALGAAARLAPEQAALQLELGEVRFALEDWNGAAAAFVAAREAAARAPAPALAEPSRLALRQGQLALRRGDLDTALALCEEALGADPPPRGALAVACHQARQEALSRAGRWREVAAALQAAAEDGRTEEPLGARLAARFAAAEILRRRIGDGAAAEPLYEAVLAAEPDHLGALNGLTVIAASASLWERAAELLERKLELLSGAGEAVPLLEELAGLYRTQLARPQAARTAYERILERDPEHREALRRVAEDALACGDLAVARRHFEGLLAILGAKEDEEGAAPEVAERERLGIQRALARIALETGDGPAAVAALTAVLALDPDDGEALAALDERYRAEGRFEELAEVLRRRADRARSPDEAVPHLLRLGRVLAERLGRVREAAAVCREALRKAPEQPEALARLAMLLREIDAEPVERRQVLERLLALVVEGPPDEQGWAFPRGREHPDSPEAAEGADVALPARSDLLFELGLLLRGPLGEPQAGARLLEEARALGCDDLSLHRALVQAAREEGRPRALDIALDRLAARAEEPGEALAARIEQATVRLEALEAPEEALAVLAAIPAAEPPEPALAVLARVHEARGAPVEACAVHGRLADRARDRGDVGAEQAALERLLALASGELEDLALAQQTAARLLVLAPRHGLALSSLAAGARLQREAGALGDALARQAELYGEQPSGASAAADVLAELGVLRLRIGDPAGAVQAATQAAEHDPEHLGARILAAQARALSGDFEGALSVLEELSRRLGRQRSAEEEPRAFLGNLHREIAELAAERLGDGARARAAYRAAAGLLAGSSLTRVLEAWRGAAAAEGRWSEAAEVAERLRALRSEANDAVHLAEAYEHLGRLDDALRVLRDAPPPRGPETESDALAQAVRARTRELLTAAGRFGELARTLEEDARRAEEPSRRRELLLEAAEHYAERAGEGGRAERCLLTLLEDDPLCLPAVQGLVQRAEAGRAIGEVTAALVRAAERALEASTAGGDLAGAALEGLAEERLAILSQVAHHRLRSDPDDAAAHGWLGAVLTARPADLSALTPHADHLERTGQPAALVARLLAALSAPDLHAGHRGDLRLRAARVTADALGDPGGALTVLTAGEAEDPLARPREALLLEAELLERLGRLEEAEGVLCGLAEGAEAPAALLERAAALAERRGDAEAELRALRRLADFAETDEARDGLLLRLAARCEAAGDREGQERAQAELVTTAREPGARADRLLALGRTRSALGRWDEAQEALTAAAASAPGVVAIHRELARVAAERGDLEAARIALATAHDLLPEPDREGRAEVSLERSRQEVALGGDRALARRYARQAAEETRLADRRAGALRRAAALAADLEDAGQEEEALRALHELGVAEPAELGRLAALCEARDAWAEALAIYEHLREQNPENPVVRRRLASALRVTGQRSRAVAELVAAGEAWVARQEGPEAAKAFAEAAGLRLGESAEDAEAGRLLRRAMAADPASDAVFGQAARLCRQQGDDEGLLEVLQRRLPALDPAGQQAAYREMATVARERLGDPDRAATFLALGLAAGGDDPALLSALVLYHGARGEWPVALDYGLRLDAVGGPPDELALDVHERLADGALATDERALARIHLRRALRAAPDAEGVRQRLEALLVEEGDHAALLALLQERAAMEEGATRTATLVRSATLAEQTLEDLALAEQLLAEALEGSPEDEAVRARLIALLRRRERWPALFAELQASYARVRGPRRAELADQLADLAETQLGDPATAQHFRRQALRDAPADVRRLRALVDLLASQRQWTELVELVEEAVDTMVLDAESAAGFYALLGRSYLEKLNRPDRALTVFERARARGALTPRSGELLGELYEASGRFSDLAALLEEVAERTTDPAISQRLLVKRARVLADHLGRASEAATVLLELFRMAPERRRKLGAMARKLLQQARLYGDALRVLEEELQAAPESEQAELLLDRGVLFETALGRTEDALASYLRVLELSPGFPPAHLRVARLLFETGERERALHHAEAVIRAADPERLAEAHTLAGHICVELDRPEDAASHLEQSLRHDPTDLAVVKELAHLYTAAGHWDRLAENMGRELALTVEPVARARLWFRRALVYRDMLDRGGDALRCFREAANADPQNAEAVAALRDFALERGDWETSLALLDRQLELEQSPAVRAQLLGRRADLLENRLGRLEDAFVTVEEALALSGGADELLTRKLLRLCLARQDWSRAAALERQLADRTGSPTERAAALLRVGELHRRAGEVDAAFEVFAEVVSGSSLEALPGAAEQLAELATTAPAQERLLTLLEERLASLRAGAHRQGLLQILVRIAQALGDEARATRHADALFAVDPSDRVAFQHRRRRLEGAGDPRAFAELLAQRLTVASTDESWDLLLTLGRLQRDQLGEPDAAARTFDVLLERRPDDLVALDARADLAYQRGEFAEARTLYARIGGARGSLDRGELAYRQGRIAEALGEEDVAVAEYGRAVAERPGHVPALEALARLHLLHQRDADALDPLTALCEALPPAEGERALACGLQLARVRLRLGRSREAEEGLAQLAREHPERPVIWDRLAEVQRSRGHWAGLADTLGELARQAPTPARRARRLYEEGEVRLERLHDPEGATRRFLQAADLAPEDPDVLRRLAEHYAQLGRWAEARAAFAGILEVVPAAQDPEGARRGAAALGLALASLLGGGDAVREAPTLIRRPEVEAVSPEQAAEVLAAVSQGLYGQDQATPGLRRIFDLADSALGRACLPRWTDAAERLAQAHPADLGLRRLLTRLISRVGEAAVAALHEAAARFLDPPPPGLAPLPPERRRAAPPRSLKVLGPAVIEGAKVPLRTLLAGLHPQLGRVAAPIDPAVLGPEVDDVTNPALFALCEEVRAALEVGPVGVAFAREPRVPVTLLYSHPPVMLLDPAVADWPEAEARFLVGRACEWLRSGSLLLETEPPERVAAILDTVALLFEIPMPDAAQPDGALLERLRARGFTPDLFDNATMESLQVAFFNHYRAPAEVRAYLEAERHVANRIGLLAGADLEAGLTALARTLLARVGAGAGTGTRAGAELPADPAARRRLVYAEPELEELLRFGTSPLFHQLRRHRSTLPRT